MSVEPRTGPVEESVSGRVSVPSATLVLLPHLDDCDRGVCLDLLTVSEPSGENVLAVSFEETPAAKSRRWDDALGVQPNDFAVVDVDPDPKAAPRPAGSNAGDGGPAAPTVHEVSDPGDLASLGEAIGEQLSRWADREARPVVCFQSLTALLDHVDLRRLFRFLYTLGHRLKAAGAVSHFHLDPAVDDRTIHTLLPVFDTVVRRDGSELRVTDSSSY